MSEKDLEEEVQGESACREEVLAVHSLVKVRFLGVFLLLLTLSLLPISFLVFPAPVTPQLDPEFDGHSETLLSSLLEPKTIQDYTLQPDTEASVAEGVDPEEVTVEEPTTPKEPGGQSGASGSGGASGGTSGGGGSGSGGWGTSGGGSGTGGVWHDGWTEVIHHPAVYQEVWHPEVGHYADVCNICGLELGPGEGGWHLINTGHVSYSGDVYIMDSPAWIENVLVSTEWDEYIDHPGYWG